MILNRIVIIIFFVATSFFAKAQQIHFVYLQTENGQPFYVKLDNKVTSSSSAGYLILPKLSEGDYNISVGFPKKEFPEESFQISVDSDNKGFLLKNFGEKGWGLFNLQSFALVMGNNSNNSQVALKNLEDDSFSKMLATVVKDSSILVKNSAGQVTPSAETVSVDAATKIPEVATKSAETKAKKGDTLAAIGNTEQKIADTATTAEDTVELASQNTGPLVVSTISRTLQKKNADGIEMVYIDRDENTADTIRLFIPADASMGKAHEESKEVVKEEIAKEILVSDTAAKLLQNTAIQQNEDSLKSVAADVSKNIIASDNKDSIITGIKNKKNSDSNNLKPLATIDITGEEIKNQSNPGNEIPKVVNSSSTNSDCKEFASNDDFIKLRKKLAGENNKEEMIKLVKKFFRLQCYSTEQIKNLSFLFLSDEGKYQFFEAAYPFTSDSSQYHVLQSQLKDPFYVNKFKAMIHK